MRRIPYQYQNEFDQILADLIMSKKIQPSTSSWASPLRLLRKKDGTLRVTVDYQAINNVTEKVAYPLPLIDEIFHRLRNAKYFTLIDLTSGYYQVPLEEKSRKFSAFICPRGLFEWLVMPMGLTNAVETFQEMMNRVLKGYLGKICEVYLDDIIIYSSSLEEHIKHVNMVVKRLKRYNLKIKSEKCKIAQTKIEYLSHVIYDGKMEPSPTKTADLFKFQEPLTVQQTHSFIGLGGYYRKFINNYSSLISPLLRYVQQNGKLEWDNGCSQAFNCLREKLTNSDFAQVQRAIPS